MGLKKLLHIDFAMQLEYSYFWDTGVPSRVRCDCWSAFDPDLEFFLWRGDTKDVLLLLLCTRSFGSVRLANVYNTPIYFTAINLIGRALLSILCMRTYVCVCACVRTISFPFRYLCMRDRYVHKLFTKSEFQAFFSDSFLWA